MMTDHGKHYSESAFRKKFEKLPLIGPLQERVLLLWLVLHDPDTPKWVKGVAVFCLGYLILTLDSIPDFLPVGLVDDAVLVAATVITVRSHISGDIRTKAHSMTKSKI
jgi:uncharacterized membrane protein YkvA (DUF1232 family)